jgi:hypothetical protein
MNTFKRRLLASMATTKRRFADLPPAYRSRARLAMLPLRIQPQGPRAKRPTTFEHSLARCSMTRNEAYDLMVKTLEKVLLHMETFTRVKNAAARDAVKQRVAQIRQVLQVVRDAT